MVAISCEEMRAMDSYTIDKIGIPSIVLMERASLEAFSEIDESFESFTLVSGIGNNGGDGLAICRHLFLAGKDLKIFIVGDPHRGSQDFKLNLKILENLGLDYIRLEDEDDLELLSQSLVSSQMTIDAIFGTGLSRNITGFYRKIIELINQESNFTFSIDIPSGLDGDSGDVLATSIRANKTVSFHKLKHGLKKNLVYTGELVVKDIGIPDLVTKKFIKK